MPPGNLRGGKSYKKHKKAPHSEKAAKFQSKEDGQDYARVLRLLGDRRASCFCNDGVERIGRFRGAICRGPKKQFIEVGDIVLISLREFENGSDNEVAIVSKNGPCDILYKYDRGDWRNIAAEPGSHDELLGNKKEIDDIFEGVSGSDSDTPVPVPESVPVQQKTYDDDVDLNDL